ncbi:MAG: hypothetical protein AAB583_04715, partial [Patescibacteria group bacterium]
WDLPQYAVGDFDGDGHDDLVTFTGCGFFSSAEKDKVPQNQLCISPILTKMVLKNQDLIGQKYIAVQKLNFETGNSFHMKRPISHSYLFKKKNENWKIFVNSGELTIFEIRKDGLLQKIDNVPIQFKLDEILYFMSGLYIYPTLFSPFYILGIFVHPLVSLILLVITTIIFFIWKKINPFSKIDSMME